MRLLNFLKTHSHAILSCVYGYICFACVYFAWRYYEKPSVFSIFVIIALLSFLFCVKHLFLLLKKHDVFGKIFRRVGRALGGIVRFFYGSGSVGDDEKTGKLFVGGTDKIYFGRNKKSKTGDKTKYPKLKNMKSERDKIRY